jgi:hypothetical protein
VVYSYQKKSKNNWVSFPPSKKIYKWDFLVTGAPPPSLRWIQVEILKEPKLRDDMFVTMSFYQINAKGPKGRKLPAEKTAAPKDYRKFIFGYNPFLI